jgi:membrane associated rhomboid family serine protease
MTETTAVLNGQAWRLCTSLSLHADIRHLLGNLTFGTLLLGFAMARYGAGWTQLTTMLCGVAANAVSATVHGLDHRSLGASGMVMAALGMLAAGTVNLGAVGVSLRAWLFRGCLAAGLLFVLIGLDPESDVVAHAAGFASGGVAGVLVNGLPSALRTSSRANNLTALVTLTLWIAAWSAAFASF